MPGTRIEDLTADTVLSSAEMDSYQVPMSDGTNNRKITPRRLRKFPDGPAAIAAGDVPTYSDALTDFTPQNPRWRILDPATDYSPTVPTLAIASATTTSSPTPIMVTVTPDSNGWGHKLQTGMHVKLSTAQGSVAANSVYEVDCNTQLITDEVTNASPIVITVFPLYHGFSDGDKVRVEGVRGNTAANSTNAEPAWYVKKVAGATGVQRLELYKDAALTIPVNGTAAGVYRPGSGFISWADKFRLFRLDNATRVNVSACAAGTGGVVKITTSTSHGFQNYDRVIVVGVLGTTEANNSIDDDTWQIQNRTDTTFELVGVTFVNAYTSGGTAELAWSNSLVAVSGTGTGSGTMIRPGRITIVASGGSDSARIAAAQAKGFFTGLPLRMKAGGQTNYGIIGSIPGFEGYPYTRDDVSPVNVDNEMTFAGPPLLDNLTELAIGQPEQVQWVTIVCGTKPYFGSSTTLPLSQLVQNTPATRVDKWRMSSGGSTVHLQFGNGYTKWLGPDAFCVAWEVLEKTLASQGPDGGHLLGTTLTIIPDSERPYNSFEQHTDGSVLKGALLTRTGGNLTQGNPLTGLRGQTVLQLDDPNNAIQQFKSVIKEGGAGSEGLLGVVGASGSDIVITTASAHGLTTGCKVTIFGVTGNTAANVTSQTITKLTNTTFSLDGIASNGAYGGIQSAKTITGATNATPIVITAVAHGFANDDQVVISGVTGNTAANGLWSVKNKTTDTFELKDYNSTSSIGNGGYAGGGTVTQAGGYVMHGLGRAKAVLEDMVYSLAANTHILLQDVTVQPSVNIDILGQLLSPNDMYRGLRLGRLSTLPTFAPAVEINRESYDVKFDSRIEIACTSLGNRPGVVAASNQETGLGGAEHLTIQAAFVIK